MERLLFAHDEARYVEMAPALSAKAPFWHENVSFSYMAAPFLSRYGAPYASKGAFCHEKCDLFSHDCVILSRTAPFATAKAPFGMSKRLFAHDGALRSRYRIPPGSEDTLLAQASSFCLCNFLSRYVHSSRRRRPFMTKRHSLRATYHPNNYVVARVVIVTRRSP